MGEAGQHIPAPIPRNDAKRVEFLRSLNVLDTEAEESFDRITDAAQRAFDVPIALVSLVDADRQWFKSCIGLDVDSTHRDVAFCAHAILPEIPVTLVVEDATQDRRFKNSSLVLGPPYIRFYAGAPLLYTADSGEEWKLGSLCIIDTKPRKITEPETQMLEMLARLVVTELELRMKLRTQIQEAVTTANQSAVVQAAEMHTAYIGQVVHDLRTPLDNFMFGLQALKSLDDKSPEMVSIIDTMKVSLELMDTTCSKATDHSKFESGKDLKSKHAPFNITDVIKRSQIVVSNDTHQSKNVNYEYMIEEGVAEEVITDKEWFWHMLINLLSNARKFTTEGYIRTLVGIVSEGGQEYMTVRVADTGIGIDEEHRKQLFSNFSHLQDSVGGLGFGLFSVLKKVSMLGGSCGVDANLPKGSVFWFRIPYVPNTETGVAHRTADERGKWHKSNDITHADQLGDGVITKQELKKALGPWYSPEGAEAAVPAAPVKPIKMAQVTLDELKSIISLSVSLSLIKRSTQTARRKDIARKKEAKHDFIQQIEAVFAKFGPPGSLDKAQITELLKTLNDGVAPNDTEVHWVFENADQIGNGKIAKPELSKATALWFDLVDSDGSEEAAAKAAASPEAAAAVAAAEAPKSVSNAATPTPQGATTGQPIKAGPACGGCPVQ